MGASQTALPSAAAQKTPNRKSTVTGDANKSKPAASAAGAPETAPPDNPPATVPNPPAPQR
jgi:hypothetical protein